MITKIEGAVTVFAPFPDQLQLMLLMVIDDLDRISLTILPYETDTPLIVDPDTMRPLSCTFQCLKTIGWRHSEVPQLLHCSASGVSCAQ